MFHVPANIILRPGQTVRFNALGGFMRVEDSVSNGLGFLFRVQPDLTLRRYFF